MCERMSQRRGVPGPAHAMCVIVDAAGVRFKGGAAAGPGAKGMRSCQTGAGPAGSEGLSADARAAMQQRAPVFLSWRSAPRTMGQPAHLGPGLAARPPRYHLC